MGPSLFTGEVYWYTVELYIPLWMNLPVRMFPDGTGSWVLTYIASGCTWTEWVPIIEGAVREMSHTVYDTLQACFPAGGVSHTKTQQVHE